MENLDQNGDAISAESAAKSADAKVALMAEWERTRVPPMVSTTESRREPLPLSTGIVCVPRGETAQITARPQRVAFRPERLFVSNFSPEYRGPWWKRICPWYRSPALYGAADWIINDMSVGRVSQLAQAGNIPGDMFASAAIDSFVRFDTMALGMEFVLVVTYVGACPSGCPFTGCLIGTSAF